MTKSSVAKMLIQTGYLDEYIHAALQMLRDGVLSATDETLVARRREFLGAQQFAETLKMELQRLYETHDPEQRARQITP